MVKRRSGVASGAPQPRGRVAAAGSFPKPIAYPDQGRKNTPFGFGNAVTARGDPTSPDQQENKRQTTGYVGQAARPPCQGLLERLCFTRRRGRGVQFAAGAIRQHSASPTPNSRTRTTTTKRLGSGGVTM